MKDKLTKRGMVVTPEILKAIYEATIAFINQNHREKGITDEEFIVIATSPKIIQLIEENPMTDIHFVDLGYSREAGRRGERAVVVIRRGNQESRHEINSSAGPIDAAKQALEQMTERKFTLEDWKPHAETAGSSSVAHVEVCVKNGTEEIRVGHGYSGDTIEATVRAIINAVNSFKPKFA